MSDPTTPCVVQFLTLSLSDEREACVGFNIEDRSDRSYFFRFKASDGVETKMRLSEEAFAAIIRLKGEVDVYRDTNSVMRWVVHINTESGDMKIDTTAGGNALTPGEPHD